MPRSRKSLSSAYRSALVTGASSGLGQAIANRLLKEGLQVHGTTRNPSQDNLDPKVNWLCFEGSDRQSVSDWIQENGELLTNLDLLVNNCGSGLFGDTASVDADREASLLQLLLGTPIALTKAVLPTMRARGGAIVNVSSLASQFPLPYMSGYTSTKAGLSAYTQSLMLTETGRGMVLIDFQPGDFKTAFNKNMVRSGEAGGTEAIVWAKVETLLKEAPLPERGAEDLVSALKKGRHGIVRSGGFFQTCIAPLGIRFLPRKWLLGSIRRYYQLGDK